MKGIILIIIIIILIIIIYNHYTGIVTKGAEKFEKGTL